MASCSIVVLSNEELSQQSVRPHHIPSATTPMPKHLWLNLRWPDYVVHNQYNLWSIFTRKISSGFFVVRSMNPANREVRVDWIEACKALINKSKVKTLPQEMHKAPILIDCDKFRIVIFTSQPCYGFSDHSNIWGNTPSYGFAESPTLRFMAADCVYSRWLISDRERL